MLKRLLSAAILMTLLVHLAGVYVFTIVRMGEIRMEKRRQLASLPADKLDVLQIPAAQFRDAWMDEREMEWQGKMYDIARVTRSGDIMIVYGLHDADEDDLLAFLSAVVNMVRQDTQPAPSSVMNFFSLEFITTSALIPQPAQLVLASTNSATYIVLPDVALDPAFPPPRQ